MCIPDVGLFIPSPWAALSLGLIFLRVHGKYQEYYGSGWEDARKLVLLIALPKGQKRDVTLKTC